MELWRSCESEPLSPLPPSGPTFDPQDVLSGQNLSQQGPYNKKLSEDKSSVPARSPGLNHPKPEKEAPSELRIILRDSTRVTLDQRFSDIMKNKPLIPVILRAALQHQSHHRQPQQYLQYRKRPQPPLYHKQQHRYHKQQQQFHQQCQHQQQHSQCHHQHCHQHQHCQQYQHQQQSGGSRSASAGASTSTATSGYRHRKLAQQLDNLLSAQTPATPKPEKRLGKGNIQAHLGCHTTPVTRASAAGGWDLPPSHSTLPCRDMRGGKGGRATRVQFQGGRGGRASTASRELSSYRCQELPQGKRAVSPSQALRRGGSRGQENPGRVGTGAGALAHRLLMTHGPLARSILAAGGVPGVVSKNSSSNSSNTVAIGNRGSRCHTRGWSQRGFDQGRSGHGRGSSLPPLTKEYLDNQLDAYMIERKLLEEDETDSCPES